MNDNPTCELVYSSDPNQLSETISDRIAEGWWPIGRPFVHGEHYIQAMVRDCQDLPWRDEVLCERAAE